MAASKRDDRPGRNISIKDYFMIVVHFFETILQIHVVARRLCESSPRAQVCFLFAIQCPFNARKAYESEYMNFCTRSI